MDKYKVIETLESALDYVQRSYECAFPDSEQNETVHLDIQIIIEAIKNGKIQINS